MGRGDTIGSVRFAVETMQFPAGCSRADVLEQIAHRLSDRNGYVGASKSEKMVLFLSETQTTRVDLDVLKSIDCDGSGAGLRVISFNEEEVSVALVVRLSNLSADQNRFKILDSLVRIFDGRFIGATLAQETNDLQMISNKEGLSYVTREEWESALALLHKDYPGLEVTAIGLR